MQTKVYLYRTAEQNHKGLSYFLSKNDLPESFEVLKVEADIEEGEEGVHKLEDDQLHRHVDIVLLLGPAHSNKEQNKQNKLSDVQCCGAVFGPPGSGSFYYQAKIVRKTLVHTDLSLLYDFLSLKMM